MNATQIVDVLRGGLIVSCQAYPGEPLRHTDSMMRMAQAAVAGGAVAVRLEGLGDIRAVRAVRDVPIIGLWKERTDGVFITPTIAHGRAVADAGADIVAIDGTRRARPDGMTLAATIEALHRQTGKLIMADCGSLDDARHAESAGADFIGTTLAGYTGERIAGDGPDLELISQISSSCSTPLIAEGRIRTTEQAAEALARGAHAVCVGTAITHPTTITQRFVAALGDRGPTHASRGSTEEPRIARGARP